MRWVNIRPVNSNKVSNAILKLYLGAAREVSKGNLHQCVEQKIIHLCPPVYLGDRWWSSGCRLWTAFAEDIVHDVVVHRSFVGVKKISASIPAI